MNTHFEQLYDAARRTVTELRRQLAAQHKYIAELEKQLEPEVVAEIRNALSLERTLEDLPYLRGDL